jgi:hypothetical protein
MDALSYHMGRSRQVPRVRVLGLRSAFLRLSGLCQRQCLPQSLLGPLQRCSHPILRNFFLKTQTKTKRVSCGTWKTTETTVSATQTEDSLGHFSQETPKTPKANKYSAAVSRTLTSLSKTASELVPTISAQNSTETTC